jgi:hypothetical protein
VRIPDVMYLMAMQFSPAGLFASVLSVRSRVWCGTACPMAALVLVTALADHARAAAPGEPGAAAMPAIAEAAAARPAGLAGAHTALGVGPSALGVNPAGLARDTGVVYQGSLRAHLTRSGAVAWSFPAMGGQWAVSATYVDYDVLTETDENMNVLGTLRPFNLYPAVTYARALGEHLHVGGTFKLAHETLGAFEGATSAWGAGLDAGLQYQMARNLTVGAAVTNIGRQFSGYYEGDTRRGILPLAVRGGVAYQPRGNRQLTLVADAVAPWHASPYVALGAEYAVMPEWTVRGGTRWSGDDVRNLVGVIDPNAGIEERGGEAVKLAAGTTVQVGPVAVDYAAQWWRELGVVQSLTVSWQARGR